MDSLKIGKFISMKRKDRGMTQQQLAERLNISFQAVSKWENGTTYPNIESLCELAACLGVSVDEILAGCEKNGDGLSYSRAGVDIAYTDAIKKEMSGYLKTSNERVLNGIGPFASLYDIHFPEMREPVLVLKSEEPGSKQKLAMEYGYTESICHDMINHLVNDIVVMGARPLAVLDTIVCGRAQKETIKTLVKGIADACRENDCSLVGGETSIQPQVVSEGTYILTSSIVGVVEKRKVVDGSRIAPGDSVLAVASNGLHTNGYSLVRLLLEKRPEMKLEKVEGMTFLERIMEPHTPYYPALKGILGKEFLHGMAHITGGGIEGNTGRIIPDGLTAKIDQDRIRVPELFRLIQERGNVDAREMFRTFNMGVGFILIVPPEKEREAMDQVSRLYDCYEIGTVEKGEKKVDIGGFG